MFISPDEVRGRVESDDNLVNLLRQRRGEAPPTDGDGGSDNLTPEPPSPEVSVLPMHPSGRREGSKGMPPFLREIVGTAAHLSTGKSVAQAFGISRDHTYELKQGKHSKAQGTNADLKERIGKNLGEIQDKALALTMASLGLMTEDKLEILRAPELARVAKDTASVYEKLAPKTPDQDNRVQVFVYAPRERDESEYETIHLSPSA